MRILVIILLLISFQKKDSTLYNKHGKPSSIGITQFINKNHDNIIAEYEFKIDTLFDIFIYTEDLGSESEGVFYLPGEIIINNREIFIEFEFKNLTKFRQKISSYNDRTVKATAFHELTHVYFYQAVYLLQNSGIRVMPEYQNIRLIPTLNLGATFIEEGVCEYVVYYLKETAPIFNSVIPTSEKELLDELNRTNTLYVYSVLFLRDFLDEYGIQKGVEILLTNSPPSYKEMLEPKLFFNRLIK